MAHNLWQETPLIYSNRLSERTGASIYLKLENLHPSYSFKYRGISHFVRKAKAEKGSSVHVVAASGGNAGLAAACAARILKLKCTVFIPTGVAESTLKLLREEEAEVVVGGKHYAEALKAAQAVVASENEAVLVPAYDDPIVWEGHSSMIHEIQRQLSKEPAAIFCSVGGGGLLGGLIVGCKSVGWDHVPIIAMETMGSDCFYHSLSLNNGRFNSELKTLPLNVEVVHNDDHSVYLAHFNSFSSKASGSLGASEPSAGVTKMALERTGGIRSVTVPDEMSMEALVSFADDHKFLVELACSTTLVPAYHPALFTKLTNFDNESMETPIYVFIICGGFKIDLVSTNEYRSMVEDFCRKSSSWTVKCDDGEAFSFEK